MKHLRMVSLAVALAMALTAFVGVASASAAPKIHPSSTAFTGTGTLLETVGTHKYVSSFTTNGGEGPFVKCEESGATGTTQAGTTEEVTAKVTFGKCFSNIGGTLVAANVTVPLEWHLKLTIGLTPPFFTLDVKTTGTILIKVPAVGCTISVAEQEVMAEGKNDAGTPPAGTTINPTTATPIEVAYTQSGCAGVVNGNSKYRGAVHIPTIYAE